MKWVSIKHVSEVTKKPERTIRHYAAQGKIRVKKDGAKWLCDLNSIQELGWIAKSPQPEIPAVPEVIIPNQSQSSKEIQPEQSPPKKVHVLDSLGVFREMLLIARNVNQKPDSFSEKFRLSIQSVGLGFYEYQTALKIQHFSIARNHLVTALLHLYVDAQSESTQYKDQIEKSILPGLGGLIRKMERRRNAKDPRFQDSAKN